MDDPVLITYNEQLSLLPPINQEALKSLDWNALILGIGKSRGLHIDELDDLRTETMLVLIGELDAESFAQTLIERLGLPPAEIDKLVSEVNSKIFQPIHDYILSGGPTVAAIATKTAEPTTAPAPAESTPMNEPMQVVSEPDMNAALASVNITPIDMPVEISEPTILTPINTSTQPLEDAGITALDTPVEVEAPVPTSDSMRTLSDLLNQQSPVAKESEAIQKLEEMLAEKHSSVETSNPAAVVRVDLGS